jgi:S1-C subfamily serine protease
VARGKNWVNRGATSRRDNSDHAAQEQVFLALGILTRIEDWEEQEPERPAGHVAIAPMVACALAGVATLVALWAWHGQQAASGERAALRSQVVDLQQTVKKLSGRDTKLTTRLTSAEQTLHRREAGVAPLAKRALRSVFTVHTTRGLGSSFVAWEDGDATYLLTAAHVVEGEASGTVRISRKGGSWSAEVAKIDHKNDLAVLRVNGHPAGAAPLWQNSHGPLPQQGDQVLLIGSPYGLSGTVTTGVVSRVTAKEIQTDAAANPGNSGGPALDKAGRIVGVLVSGGGENINFAIRVERACAKLRDC